MENILTKAVACQCQLAQLANSDALGQVVLLHPLAQIPVLRLQRLIGHQGAGTAKAAAVAALAIGFELQVAEISEQRIFALDKLAIDHHADPDVVVDKHQHRIGAIFGGPHSRSAWIQVRTSPLTSTGTENACCRVGPRGQLRRS